MRRAALNCTVAIVGGGTAGLSLARELGHRGIDNVVVIERESEAGGVPRHCGHYPFGFWEMKRLMKGPDYASALVRGARAAGADIRTGTSVTALHPNARLSLSTPEGPLALQAERVVLCTGVRESSRAQLFLGGQRPQGVISTGALQSMVYRHGLRPFRRPVILGSELVSFSAIMTCRHLGMRPVAMIEANNRVTVRRFVRPYAALKGVPLIYNAADLRILGHRLVEAVDYLDARGRRQRIECDGVIVSGNFRPESALLHASHIAVDAATGGPSVDQYGRTSDPGYFCTGNLLRPVETSAWCWQEALDCAGRVIRDLDRPIGTPDEMALRPADAAIRYVVPQRLVRSDAPGAMKTMQIRLDHPAAGYLTAGCAGRSIWSGYLQSRPERRILAPLSPVLKTVLKTGLNTPVQLKIIGKS